MKNIYLIVLVTFLPLHASSAENHEAVSAKMKEDIDGRLDTNEYRVINKDGSLTRRPCPYTCQMRGIPKEHCKEFKSKDNSECYVKDTRFPDTEVVR